MVASDNTILESRSKNGKWSEPEVASFSGVWRDSEPHVAPDGKRLFFVSNRPAKEGETPLVATFGTRTFPGANIWYVERKSDGNWGEPIHIEAAMNEYKTVYNPSVARNGTLYFSGVLPDDPAKNQIYRSIFTNGAYSKPERVSFSDTKWNHIDPSVDPDERFMVFASNRPGATANSNDIFIVFQKDGKWGEPIALGETVNSPSLENAPVLAPDGKTVYFTSARAAATNFPKKRETFADVKKRLQSIENGSRNIWQVDISEWLAKAGIK
jgi:Tol biopolymer transport system component